MTLTNISHSSNVTLTEQSHSSNSTVTEVAHSSNVSLTNVAPSPAGATWFDITSRWINETRTWAQAV